MWPPSGPVDAAIQRVTADEYVWVKLAEIGWSMVGALVAVGILRLVVMLGKSIAAHENEQIERPDTFFPTFGSSFSGSTLGGRALPHAPWARRHLRTEPPPTLED
jgi:hypothetical protein